MKQTLTLKKPLSLEKQAKLFQQMGFRDKPPKKLQQKGSDRLAIALKKRRFSIAVDWLAKTYPHCFDPKNPKPLKKGILEDILKQGLWTESKTSLRDTLTFYVSSPFYHQALLKEKARYDLEGNEVEELTASEKEFSKQRLKILKAGSFAACANNTMKKKERIDKMATK